MVPSWLHFMFLTLQSQKRFDDLYRSCKPSQSGRSWLSNELKWTAKDPSRIGSLGRLNKWTVWGEHKTLEGRWLYWNSSRVETASRFLRKGSICQVMKVLNMHFQTTGQRALLYAHLQVMNRQFIAHHVLGSKLWLLALSATQPLKVRPCRRMELSESLLLFGTWCVIGMEQRGSCISEVIQGYRKSREEQQWVLLFDGLLASQEGYHIRLEALWVPLVKIASKG